MLVHIQPTVEVVTWDAPINYAIGLGADRLRPALCETPFGGRFDQLYMRRIIQTVARES